MTTSVVLEYHLAIGRVGYVVHALLKFEVAIITPRADIAPHNLHTLDLTLMSSIIR